MNQSPTTPPSTQYTFPTIRPIPSASSSSGIPENHAMTSHPTGACKSSTIANSTSTECEWENTDFASTRVEVLPPRETYYDASTSDRCPDSIFPSTTQHESGVLAGHSSSSSNTTGGSSGHFEEAQCRPTTRVWGTAFSRVNMQQAIELADQTIQAGRPEYFITANLNYLMLTDDHPRLSEVNKNCSCILADGFPIVMRSRLSKHPLPCRVAGSDMIIELAHLAATKGYRVFFLGGAPGVAQAAVDHLQSRFPKLKVAGVLSPPFRALSVTEQSELIQSIRNARTDILLVAFGQPKGEFWIYDHRDELGVPLSIQLGASFDFLAGTARRAPRAWQTIGCEWLYRALSDPMRLVPRYSKNVCFLGKLLLWDIKEFIEKIFGWPVFEPLERFFAQLKQLDQQNRHDP